MKKNEFLKVLVNTGSAALVSGTALLYKQYKARQKDLMNKNQGKQK